VSLESGTGYNKELLPFPLIFLVTERIEVKDEKWKMRAEVIAFKAVSGAHSGENLGRYAMGLLDRVGIMDKKRSKACRFTWSRITINLNVHYL